MVTKELTLHYSINMKQHHNANAHSPSQIQIPYPSRSHYQEFISTTNIIQIRAICTKRGLSPFAHAKVKYHDKIHHVTKGDSPQLHTGLRSKLKQGAGDLKKEREPRIESSALLKDGGDYSPTCPVPRMQN